MLLRLLRTQHRFAVAFSLRLDYKIAMVAFAFSVWTLTIAIPSIMAGLRANVDRLQWMITSFDTSQTVVMPAVSWLVRILGNGLQGHLSYCGEIGLTQDTTSLALLNQYIREEAIFASYQDICIVGGMLSVVAWSLSSSCQAATVP